MSGSIISLRFSADIITHKCHLSKCNYITSLPTSAFVLISIPFSVLLQCFPPAPTFCLLFHTNLQNSSSEHIRNITIYCHLDKYFAKSFPDTQLRWVSTTFKDIGFPGGHWVHPFGGNWHFSTNLPRTEMLSWEREWLKRWHAAPSSEAGTCGKDWNAEGRQQNPYLTASH